MFAKDVSFINYIYVICVHKTHRNLTAWTVCWSYVRSAPWNIQKTTISKRAQSQKYMVVHVIHHIVLFYHVTHEWCTVCGLLQRLAWVLLYVTFVRNSTVTYGMHRVAIVKYMYDLDWYDLIWNFQLHRLYLQQRYFTPGFPLNLAYKEYL